jgi:hypothetical protein
MIERQRRAAKGERVRMFQNGALGMLDQSRAVRAEGPSIRFPPSDLWHLA